MASTPLTPFGNALAGAFGGCASNAIVYPLDTVKTRLQAENPKDVAKELKRLPSPAVKRQGAPHRLPGAPKPGVREVARMIWNEYGMAGFYRGFPASMINTFSMQFAYFYWYTIVRQTYTERFTVALPGGKGANLNTATELSLGAIAGAFAQIFTIPVSVIATRQQLDTSEKASTFLQTGAAVLKDDGITGLWRGLKPSLVLTINPSITYGAFERFKVMFLGPDGKMTPYKAFLIGALSKTIATVVTFPYILAKLRLQARYEDDSPSESDALETLHRKKGERYKGAVDCLIKIYQEQGLLGWYKGMQAQIVKAVLAQALLFYFKDVFERWTIQFLTTLAAMRGGKKIGLK